MEKEIKPKCPNCGKPLIKNGKRNNKQRWKCKNKHCQYYVTDEAKTNALKINAINYFIDFLSNSNKEVNFEKRKNIALNFRKTKFKNDPNPKLKIKKIADIRNIEKLDVKKCFIVQLNDDAADLIITKFADSEITFKIDNTNNSRVYTKVDTIRPH